MEPNPSVASDGPAGQPGVLNLYLAEMRQLFNSMDPAPFRERDLDPEAAAYMIDWAGEAPRNQTLSLVLHLGRGATTDEDAAILRKSVHEHFRRRALATRRRLQELLRVGDRLGERVCIAVSGMVEVADLMDHLRSAGLSKYDMPEYFLRVGEFPLTASGKILKRELVLQVQRNQLHPQQIRTTPSSRSA